MWILWHRNTLKLRFLWHDLISTEHHEAFCGTLAQAPARCSMTCHGHHGSWSREAESCTKSSGKCQRKAWNAKEMPQIRGIWKVEPRSSMFESVILAISAIFDAITAEVSQVLGRNVNAKHWCGGAGSGWALSILRMMQTADATFESEATTSDHSDPPQKMQIWCQNQGGGFNWVPVQICRSFKHVGRLSESPETFASPDQSGGSVSRQALREKSWQQT